MRILHLITSVSSGGAETMMVRLIEALQASGHHNHVVSLMPRDSLAPRLLACGAGLDCLDVPRGRPPGPLALHGLRRITRRFSPDLLQGWMYHGNLAASLARRLAGSAAAPVLWSIHYSLDGRSAPLTRLLIRTSAWLSHTPASIIYCSRASAAQHEAVGFVPERRVLIPNGIDCRRFRPDPQAGARLRCTLGVDPQVPLLGLFARWAEMKDHRNLLEAAARLMGEGRTFHLVLAGCGISRDNSALRTEIARLGLEARVALLGERGDIEELVPGLDLFVLPSAFGEAFPLVLIEAMAAGIPCVATDIGDSAWIVGETGRIVPPREPAALAGGIAALLDEPPEARSRRSREARARIEGLFDLPAVTARYEALYRQSLSPVAGPGTSFASLSENS